MESYISEYKYIIQYNKDSKKWIATCEEIPSLPPFVRENANEALSSILMCVEGILVTTQKNGEKLPLPDRYTFLDVSCDNTEYGREAETKCGVCRQSIEKDPYTCNYYGEVVHFNSYCPHCGRKIIGKFITNYYSGGPFSPRDTKPPEYSSYYIDEEFEKFKLEN